VKCPASGVPYVLLILKGPANTQDEQARRSKTNKQEQATRTSKNKQDEQASDFGSGDA